MNIFAAFLTWLFGVLFALTGTSEDELVLEYSIDIQAKMLKLLMTYDLKIYSFIMAEYIGIIEGKSRIIFDLNYLSI